jgi:sporulation protein YlmC with PRC-barrel domain
MPQRSVVTFMKSIIAAALTLFVVTAARAQETKPSSNPESPPIAGGAVLGVEVREIGMIASGYRVSKLLNQPVYNDKNEKIGKIEDFIVRPDGTLSYAIVDVGGFLGLGKHRVAIPVNQFTSVRPRIVLPGATKDTLKQMPEFQYSKEQA